MLPSLSETSENSLPLAPKLTKPHNTHTRMDFHSLGAYESMENKEGYGVFIAEGFYQLSGKVVNICQP
jgi:hypothetical protein